MSTVDLGIVRSVFMEFAATQSLGDSEIVAEFESVINVSEDSPVIDFKKVEAYIQRLGISADSHRGEAFVNGRHCEMDDVSRLHEELTKKAHSLIPKNFLRFMQVEIGQQLQYLQQKVIKLNLLQEHS